MALLEARAFRRAAASEADCIIVNSCGFIESAKRESINTVLELRRDFPRAKIVLTGCLARRYEHELRESLVEADVIYAAESGAPLVEALLGLFGAASDVAPAGEGAASGGAGARPLLSLPGSAYIKIAEGCGCRCSFCAIPLMRGPLVSRPIPDIAAECAALLGRGVRELCLIAQDTASFGLDTAGRPLLPALLEKLLEIRGDFWLRLLYLHPDHFPREILPLMRQDGRLLPYFDIPFQHASARLLGCMGRRGGRESYLALVNEIRAALPGAIIRSTFLTGFPSEDDADFRELRRFQEEAALDWLGVFCYSREEGTAAFRMKNQVLPETARRRKRILEAAQTPITERSLSRFCGANLDVLIEEEIDGASPLYLARAYLHAPEVDGAVTVRSPRPLTPGDAVRVLVDGCAGVDLRAAAV
jgi:ribosomal protein S12 methylthiotransferase